MTAKRNLDISVLEIIAELEAGAGGAAIQKLAARIYPYVIVQKRLPGFVRLRPRGRGTKNLSKRWVKPPSLQNDCDDWPCDNEIMANLAAGTATETLQKFAAYFLAGRIADFRLGAKLPRDHAGQPRKMRTLDREMLADAVDSIAAGYHRKGSKTPVKDALAEIAILEWEERHFNVAPAKIPDKWLATIKRYYREGIAKNAERDRGFALEIDELVARTKNTGEAPPLEYVLTKMSGGREKDAFVLRRRYERGKKSLKKTDKYGFFSP